MVEKTTELMKKYLLLKMTIPISIDSILIDNKIKELKRIKEDKKVEEVLKRIDYSIGKFFDKIGVSR